ALMQSVVSQAEKTLARTPDMLPVLKRAGVVDAGGQGLVFVYRGFLAVLQGVALPVSPSAPAPIGLPTEVKRPVSAVSAEIEFLYCTEFLLLKPSVDELTLRSALESHGDSLLVVGDEEIIKVHVHTNHPGLALEVAMEHGELSAIKIENMKEQHEHTHWAEEFAAAPAPGEGKSVGIVAVVAGTGLADVYRSLGVDLVVEGGQTMNPSTEDLAEAVNSLSCAEVIILPNNKNIVMAAEQVQYISSKTVRVVASHTIPQGLAALLSYEPDPASVEKMVTSMQRRMCQVKTGQVTYAVKTYQSDVGEVNEGDILGLANGNISAVGSDISTVSLQLLESMVTEDDGVISLFYGEDIDEEEARSLADAIEDRFPHCQLDFCNGGQPFYYYIFSVE
ncbi:MAG TPA: DAK2 domain-containing protein, partial [Bacillota bacterium]|nr:DAK2 domain-containing protein [Bacillota bacterium]